MRGERREQIIWALASFTILLTIWHIASQTEGLGKLLPSPFEVLGFISMGMTKPIGKLTIPMQILWSLGRVTVGYTLAAVLGISAGILMSWSKFWEGILRPFYLMFRSIPSIAWIPLAILWFGIGEESKYFIIFIGTFFIIMTNAADGVKGVDPILLGAARMLGASENQLFFKIVLPSAVPQIFSGLQVGLGAAWATMLAAEMVRSSEGVGWLIIAGQNSLNMVQIFSGIVLIGIVGLILVTSMRKAEDKLCAWNVRGK